MQKWICLMPYCFGWGDNQGREIGALANGLRQLKQNVDFIVLDDRTELSTNEVRCVPFADLTNPQWWKEQGSGKFLTIYGTQIMRPIYEASKKSDWEVWVRMDSDGVPGPSGGLKKYIFSKITEYVDLQRRKRKCTLQGTSLGATLGLGRGLAGCLMSWVVNERLLASFNEIDLIMVETDLSLKSFQKYFRKMRRADLVERLRIVPPAISENFQWNPHLKKNKSIVATGQWWRYQKNAEFLCKVIAASRREFPEISWHVAGGGSHLVESRLTSIGIKLGENHVQCHEHLPPDQLNKINQAASLIFYSSRQEGFPNTLCEALCCGASFVAPKGIQAFDFCASQNWGSTYASENLQSALVSIEKEMFLWESGDRSAKKLSQNATTLFHRKNVSKKLISTLI